MSERDYVVEQERLVFTALRLAMLRQTDLAAQRGFVLQFAVLTTCGNVVRYRSSFFS